MLFCIPICLLYLQDRRCRDRHRMVTIALAKNRKYYPSQQLYISSCRFVIYVDCLYVICHKIWTICCTTSRHNHQLNQYIYISFQGPSWQWSYGCWIYSFLCNQCLSPLKLWVWISLMPRCTRYNNKW